MVVVAFGEHACDSVVAFLQTLVELVDVAATSNGAIDKHQGQHTSDVFQSDPDGLGRQSDLDLGGPKHYLHCLSLAGIVSLYHRS